MSLDLYWKKQPAKQRLRLPSQPINPRRLLGICVSRRGGRIAGTITSFDSNDRRARSIKEARAEGAFILRRKSKVAWNFSAGDIGNSGHGGEGGFLFNSPPPFDQSQYLSQKGPLKSSNNPSIRAWIDPSIATTIDHRQRYLPLTIRHQSFISGGIDLTPVASSVFAYQHESRVKRSMMAFMTSGPLLPLILAIEHIKLSNFPLLQLPPSNFIQSL